LKHLGKPFRLQFSKFKDWWAKSLDMLFSVEELKTDFSNYEISILEEVDTNLLEGKFHIGKGSVVRFLAKKSM